MVPSILRWRTQRRWQAGERVQRYRRRLTAQQRDKRRQDNRRRLVGQHLSNSLCSLTGEQDRQRTATGLSQLRFVISSTSDQIFHVLSVRHMMCMMLMCYTPIMYNALKPKTSHGDIVFAVPPPERTFPVTSSSRSIVRESSTT